ncbi:hypothetical protein OS493_024992 [Desmophyllum pertusum]|uniref:Uncharacterized protein n=1 Tax=Desmophyllum pertusum TaxID=174260 RepID=A0A9W9YLK7_9CNID|nr:hypothetical protein OS493_024992 [Desmophyllum pertusum]
MDVVKEKEREVVGLQQELKSIKAGMQQQKTTQKKEKGTCPLCRKKDAGEGSSAPYHSVANGCIADAKQRATSHTDAQNA